VKSRSFSESEEKQQRYYDQIAENYDQHYGSAHNLAYRERIVDRALGGMDLAGLRVLDAMCGGGQNAAYFVARGCRVTGVDISEKQCEQYRRRFPDSDVVCASALDTGLEAESFDLVFTDSLHHLHPHVDAGMREFHRLLRPGGSLVVWEPSSGSAFDTLRKVWYRLDRTYFEDNEASIDVDRLARDNRGRFDLAEVLYGGNFGYLLVGLSMALRIPLRLVDHYAPALLKVEEAVLPLQGRRTALWVLARLVKRADARAS
jgi:ubiquinone/menaquinone biosynthesis C-methylase UbiE